MVYHTAFSLTDVPCLNTRKKSPSTEEDTFTQFSYACKQLGIELKTTSVAQAKGTLQSRLTVEMTLAGITTLEQSNEFLSSYIKKFNAKFALPVNSIKSIGIIDDINVAIDSTKIDAYEKSKPKSKLKNDSKSANWGN